MEKVGVIPLIGIPRHTLRLDPTAGRFIQQRQSNLGFGLKDEGLGHRGSLAPLLILHPPLRQI
jgi:hypothetical protein